jgi:hypothetical protein
MRIRNAAGRPGSCGRRVDATSVMKGAPPGGGRPLVLVPPPLLPAAGRSMLVMI